MTSVSEQSASLYIVATPIGNLQDVSARAIEVLQAVDLIAAEDTRHSAVLLQHFDIRTPVKSYHDFSNDAQAEKLLEKVKQGQSVALISDAGTPLISDPGYKLVRLARAKGITVTPIPGASSVIAAISVAGLASDRFVFEGFLPAKSAARQKQLDSLVAETRTLVFFESPHRIVASLQDFLLVFGKDRQIFIAREMTKKFETFNLASLEKSVEWVERDTNQQRGEFVLVLEGADPRNSDVLIQQRAMEIVSLLQAEMPLKKAVTIAAQISGARKNALYKAALAQ
ncbi:MAG: 16S rRNA (cytidine(1402)-2'-O)-methyltransferase [Gammaproteobacteria bacterium]|jgi:16S rRNA (cytidine1402-2'-O)-methyltransferase|nr:16S rRNA (cytidine(1402)-2'-O)-methyltransferase [Gammaproteobacteria bacterium]